MITKRKEEKKNLRLTGIKIFIKINNKKKRNINLTAIFNWRQSKRREIIKSICRAVVRSDGSRETLPFFLNPSKSIR